jgi:glycosyltransferase involved in cell wall biosynthesis
MGWFPEQAGGLNRYYYDLLRHLPQIGVGVRGLVTGTLRVAYESGGQVESFAPASATLLSRWWEARRAVERALAEGNFPLVVSHFALYTFPVLDLIRSRPLIIHFHGPWGQEGQIEGDWRLTTWIKGSLERAIYRRGTRLIVLSHAFRDILHRDYGLPREHIRVIPGGVDIDRFATDLTRREAREQLGWPRDRPIVLAVRRLVRRAGLEDLITAMSTVREQVPEILLLIAGEGPLVKALSAQVQSLDLNNNVRLLGFVPDEDLPLTYHAADLSVVPTLALEGFGLVAAESLAAGTPVLVTSAGGLPEVVGNLSPELVLPATGVGPLSEGLVEALTGRLTLPSAEACQAYARARYDWPVVAARVREVYAETL